MTGATEDATASQDWTDFVERQRYILHHPHGTPWPGLERAQFLCRSIATLE